METVANHIIVSFLVGFGMSAMLAFMFMQRYFNSIDKVDRMLKDFKAEGHEGKWLK